MTHPLLKRRTSGLLLHPTSLPGPYGVGDLGPQAHRFVEFLAQAGQSFWQMLPIGPTGHGASPYDSPSAFAGSPLLIALEPLLEQGLLDAKDLDSPPRLERQINADYEAAGAFRESSLRKAFSRFSTRALRRPLHDIEEFKERTSSWLPDFALYCALKRAHAEKGWTQWPVELRDRHPEALARARAELRESIDFVTFEQYQFDRQWRALKKHCEDNGIALLGDLPIYVAHDGADVWANRELFHVDATGERTVVAGVPPDVFSDDGQLWGNPLYRWEALKDSQMSWWVERFRRTFELFDALRLDHFIGFYRCWEVPAGAKTAREGRFVRVAGDTLFSTVFKALGEQPIIAEDLGVVTPQVKRLRRDCGFPGMKILQFAFGDPEQPSDYLPHRYVRNSVVYTGTHDNDTMVGWLRERLGPSATSEQRAEAQRALEYARSARREPHWDMIQLALSSVANTAIFPMQDLLGLGSQARMNEPGTVEGNWSWRLRGDELGPDLAKRMSDLCQRYERVPNRTRTFRSKRGRAAIRQPKVVRGRTRPW